MSEELGVWGFYEHVQSMWQLLWQGNEQAMVFWGASYLGLVGLASLIYQVRVRRWPSTRGVLARADLATWGGPTWARSDQQYRLDGLYRYQVAGQAFQGHRVSPWVMVASHNARFLLKQQLKGVNRHPDGSVTVYFNARRPGKSYLIRPGLPGILVTLVVAVGPMAYYWTRFHAV